MADIKITDLPSGISLTGSELFESVQTASSVKLTADQIKEFSNLNPDLLVNDTATNTPSAAATLVHTSTGTPVAGFGTGLNYDCETGSGVTTVGAIQAISTNIGAGTEAFDFLFRLIASGALSDVFKINSAGHVKLFGDVLNIATQKTIATATSTGTKGDICHDNDYIYVCIATNTWKRAAISTW